MVIIDGWTYEWLAGRSQSREAKKWMADIIEELERIR